MKRNCAAGLLLLVAARAEELPRLPGAVCRQDPLSKHTQRYCDPHDRLPRRPDAAVRSRAAVVPGPAIVSFTTLAAPKAAKRAYEKAGRELDRERPDFAKAGRCLEQAVSLYPRFAEAWQRLGETRLGLSDFQAAEKAFRAALAADPKYPPPYLRLAEMQLGLARVDSNSARVAEAARLAEQVLALNPRMSLAHYYRAMAGLALGNSRDLEQSLRAIIDNHEDGVYPGVYAMLGELRAAEGHVQSAVAAYQRFLELEPNSHAANEIRARLAEWQANGRIR